MDAFKLDVSLPLFLAAFAPIITCLLYRSLHPKPLPGIPVAYPPGCKEIPWFAGFGKQVKEAVSSGGGITDFFARGADKYSVYQIPIGPAGTWLSNLTGIGINIVCCSDPQEMDDACTRRAATFTRTKRDVEPFALALPRGQIALPSGPEHRQHRRVFGPSMTGTYLAKVLPRIEVSMDELVSLWRTRTEVMEKNGEKALEGRHDLILAPVDVITSIAFGTSLNGVNEAHDFIKSLPPGQGTASDSPPVNRWIEALFVLFNQLRQAAFSGPLVALQRFYYRKLYKPTREARRDLVELVDGRIAAERMTRKAEGPDGHAGEGEKRKVTDADHVLGIVLDMEASDMAKGNTPLPHDDLRDELSTFIFAGSETTATTLSWAVKFFSRSPEVQRRLRSELVAQIPNSLTRGGGMKYEELQDEDRLPYLHAVVWECLRASRTIGGILRTTSEDTTLLGYAIPKGTMVMFNIAWMAAPIGDGRAEERQEKLTKEGKRGCSSTRKHGYWEQEKILDFSPERWLKKGEDGIERFDRNAGPWPVFGSGVRGCFGKNLAILELKVAVVKMIGAFFFDSVPSELDTDDAEEIITRRPLQAYLRLKPYEQRS